MFCTKEQGSQKLILMFQKVECAKTYCIIHICLKQKQKLKQSIYFYLKFLNDFETETVSNDIDFNIYKYIF